MSSRHFRFVLLVLLLSSTAAATVTQHRLLSSIDNLPPELQNTTVPYPETRATYVRFPSTAKDLLAEEVANYPSPLVVEVTTVITHWHVPLWDLLKGVIHRFRAQNQIIYVKAHHYIGNGMTEHGCRIEWIDEDTGAITERAVVTDPCQQQCTNQGRYCAPEIPNDLNPANPPKKLVEETLRRLCIDDLYHASDLKHFEYLDAWKDLQCHTTDDMTECARQALAQVAHTDWASVEQCMQLAGGLDADTMNVRLQEQLDRQQGQYALDNIPLVHIAGERYKGSWDVSNLLNDICDAYPTSQQLPTQVNPMGCDFCRECDDVRHCLWYLECNERPFDIDTFRSNNNGADSSNTTIAPQTNAPIATAPPTTTPAAPSAVTTATQPPNNNNNNAPDNDDNDNDDVNTTAFFMGGILAGLVFGMVPACWFARREARTRRQISAALATRELAFRDAALDGGTYKDELDATTGTRLSPEEMENMEDIMLDEFDGLPRTPHAMVGTGQEKGNKNKKPPRIAFALNKVV
ncbi:Vacuolar-sorting receptor [Seminavis robusta]|uniref:Vacuolar-sorting receptor n=1 Tax=Seminavis robusta TaxID=568900 RepID=A0A9N8DP75_9STRA|nr:Vacuolar-sorting receptor [Seminavis robusta]|eukprot:Sro189_g081590.1 Vacuolar-sorting receptor (520) ;mRNA; r:75471-77030